MKEGVEAVRTRLAMRESFFGGGPISTREASMSATWKNIKRATNPQPPRKRPRRQPQPIEPSTAALTEEDRREKRRRNRDFSDLKSNKQGPPPKIPKTTTTKDIAAAKQSPKKKPSPVRNVMKIRHRTTALGMQTLQLVTVKAATPAKDDKNTIINRSTPQKKSDTKPVDFKGTFYGTHQPPAALRERRSMLESESDDDSLLSDFIDDADLDQEEEVSGGEDWRHELKDALGGYDASKYSKVDQLPDRRMEATFESIAEEEANAARIARAIDRREAVLEAKRRKEEEKEEIDEDKLERRLAKNNELRGFIIDDEDDD